MRRHRRISPRLVTAAVLAAVLGLVLSPAAFGIPMQYVVGSETVNVSPVQPVPVFIVNPQAAGQTEPPKTYEHVQATATDTWLIEHDLGRFPAVAVVDDQGILVEAEVQYLSSMTIIIRFTAPFAGKAYLN